MSFICRSATCPEPTQDASSIPTVIPSTTDSVDMTGPSPSSSLSGPFLVSPSLSASSSSLPSSSLPPPPPPPSPPPLAPPPLPSLSSSPPSPTITTEATISSSESASASSSSASASSSPSTVPNALSSSSSHSLPSVLKTLIIVTPSLIILFILIAFIITIYLRRKRRISRLYGSSGSIFVGSNSRRQKQPLLSKFGLKSGSNRISRLDSKDSLSPTATTPVLAPASPETAFAPEFAPALIPKPENVHEKRGRNTHQRASTVLQFEAMHPHVVLVNEDGNNSRESILIAVDGRNQDCRMVKVLQIDNEDKKRECWWKV